ncbi:MAG: dUTP diphosphatase, partial [Peptostreptococcaceae bacterium]
SNEEVIIHPGEQHIFATDIKAYMRPGECLIGNVRSSQGIKQHLSFANGLAWIDGDFFGNPTNDGNISIVLYNYGRESQRICVGDRIAQFAFMPFLVADNGNTDTQRVSGIGSTGK